MSGGFNGFTAETVFDKWNYSYILEQWPFISTGTCTEDGSLCVSALQLCQLPLYFSGPMKTIDFDYRRCKKKKDKIKQHALGLQWKHLCFEKATQYVWHENCTKWLVNQNNHRSDKAHLNETFKLTDYGHWNATFPPLATFCYMATPWKYAVHVIAKKDIRFLFKAKIHNSPQVCIYG